MTLRRRLFEALPLFAAAALVYALIPGSPPVYDDAVFLAAQRALDWGDLVSRHYFALTGERSFQPLVTALQILFSGDPVGLRVFAVALHAANGLLLCAVGRRLGLKPDAAFAAGLLFVLFPPAVEAVAIASFHGHLIAASTTLAALTLWRRERPFYTAVALTLGLLAKESALAALPLILLSEWVEPSRDPGAVRRRFGVLSAVAAAYLVYRFLILALPPAPEAVAACPVESFGWYLRLAVFPWPLSLERAAPAGWGWAAALWAVGAVWSFPRPRIWFLWLWFPIALLPALHLIPFANYSPVADRYLYAAAAPLALLLAASFYGPRSRWLLAALATAWGAAAVARTAEYRIPEGLYRGAVENAPKNPRAWGLLTQELARTGKYEEALRLYKISPLPGSSFQTRFDAPGLSFVQPPAYVEAVLHLRLGHGKEAAALLESLLRLEAAPAERAALLAAAGDAQELLGGFERADAYYAEAGTVLPSWFIPPLKRAILAYNRSRFRETMEYCRAALDRIPESPAAGAFRKKTLEVMQAANKGLIGK